MFAETHIAVCGVRELPSTIRKLKQDRHPVGNAITVRTHPEKSQFGVYGKEDYVPVELSSSVFQFALSKLSPSPFAALPPAATVTARPMRLLLPCTDVNKISHRTAPSGGMIAAAIQFGRYHALTRPQETLLINCAFGLSRSATVALAVVADLQRSNQRTPDPRECIDRVLEVRPQATFNPLLVKLVDEQLNFDGRLFEAFRTHPTVLRNQRNTAIRKRIHDLIQKIVR